MTDVDSHSSLHPEERNAANDSSAVPRKLSAGQRQVSLNAADSLNRHPSSSQLRRESSQSRKGATILNVPLSTQEPSKLVSAAGERVRAYSDGLERANLSLTRQHSDSANLLQVAPGNTQLSTHHEAHQDEHHAATAATSATAAFVTTGSSSSAQSTPSHRSDSLPYLDPGMGPVNMIAFVNFNSGGKTGRKASVVLMEQIGKENVYNLDGANPTRDLEKHLRTPNLRIAVCGGDGTVNWVLSCKLAPHTPHRQQLDPRPHTAAAAVQRHC